MTEIHAIEIEKVNVEVATRFIVTGHHCEAKNPLQVQIIAFKDSNGRRELYLDDFTYSESWAELSTEECCEAEHAMLKQVAKDFPNYE